MPRKSQPPLACSPCVGQPALSMGRKPQSPPHGGIEIGTDAPLSPRDDGLVAARVLGSPHGTPRSLSTTRLVASSGVRVVHDGDDAGVCCSRKGPAGRRRRTRAACWCAVLVLCCLLLVVLPLSLVFRAVMTHLEAESAISSCAVHVCTPADSDDADASRECDRCVGPSCAALVQQGAEANGRVQLEVGLQFYNPIFMGFDVPSLALVVAADADVARTEVRELAAVLAATDGDDAGECGFGGCNADDDDDDGAPILGLCRTPASVHVAARMWTNLTLLCDVAVSAALGDTLSAILQDEPVVLAAAYRMTAAVAGWRSVREGDIDMAALIGVPVASEGEGDMVAAPPPSPPAKAADSTCAAPSSGGFGQLTQLDRSAYYRCSTTAAPAVVPFMARIASCHPLGQILGFPSTGCTEAALFAAPPDLLITAHAKLYNPSAFTLRLHATHSTTVVRLPSTGEVIGTGELAEEINVPPRTLGTFSMVVDLSPFFRKVLNSDLAELQSVLAVVNGAPLDVASSLELGLLGARIVINDPGQVEFSLLPGGNGDSAPCTCRVGPSQDCARSLS